VSAGAGEHTERPVRPALSHDYIIRTALTMLDRDGADRLSMRRLGAELGADPMAVYYHVPNKSALFDGMVRAVYAEIDTETLPWSGLGRDLVAAYMRRLRAVLRRHPGIVPVVATRPTHNPQFVALGEQAIARLRAEGLTARQALTLCSCLQDFTVGQVLAEVCAPVGGGGMSEQEQAAATPPAALPNLAAAIAEGYDPDEQYEQGLTAFLNGFMSRERD
jgi:TetR/AcrR family transcriptional regulator, tetracycline repressor protein